VLVFVVVLVFVLVFVLTGVIFHNGLPLIFVAILFNSDIIASTDDVALNVVDDLANLFISASVIVPVNPFFLLFANSSNAN
jgi:hypothetical protein